METSAQRHRRDVVQVPECRCNLFDFDLRKAEAFEITDWKILPFGLCCGLVDLMLLACALMTPGVELWTLDSRLSALAERFSAAASTTSPTCPEQVQATMFIHFPVGQLAALDTGGRANAFKLCKQCSGCNTRNESNFPCWLGSSSSTAILLIAALPNPVNQSGWVLCNPMADQIKVVSGKGLDASVFDDLAQAFDAYSDGQWITTP